MAGNKCSCYSIARVVPKCVVVNQVIVEIPWAGYSL